MAEKSGAGAGPRIASRFRIAGLLGSGATASVYAAWDDELGRRVALKVLHPHLSNDPRSSAAFLREAIVMDRVRHPALCALLDFGTSPADEGAESWMAWELVSGGTLAETVRTRGPLPLATAISVAARILEGLQSMHEAGVVHRDISASNVLVDLTPRGELRDVRLIDFGLADHPGLSTRSADVLRSSAGDGVVGNASYASPEQLRGEGVGPAGDLYQLGGVLYFSLVGQPPYLRASIDETVAAHLDAVPPVASVRIPGIPTEVDRAIVRALLKDPDSRFSSAHEMRAALISAVGRTRLTGPSELPAATAPAGSGVGAVTRTLPAPIPREAPEWPGEDGDARAASPWTWVLAAAAAALVVLVVAATVRPAITDAVEAPAPVSTVTATAPPATVTAPTAAPSQSASPPSTVSVPSLAGLTVDLAAQLLRQSGLELGAVSETDAAAARGAILASDPGEGAAVAPGARIALAVASGYHGIPVVVGLTQNEAVDQVRASGFAPIISVERGTGQPGTVFGVEPGESTRQLLGTTVLLRVVMPPISPTPEPSTPPPTTTPTPDATP